MNQRAEKPEPTPADMVAEYITLRDLATKTEEEFKTQMKERVYDRMNALEATLLDTLNNLGADSLASRKGTVYKKLSTSVTTADMREFRRHVIGSEQWDLADWRPNKTLVTEMVAKGEALPPGVNYSSHYSVGIRRK